jgi:endonuclease/exonuclease/phosphatase family metal-dependent hydrolase
VRGVVDGQPVAITSTHLESGTSPDIQAVRAAQAAELAELLAHDPDAIVMGDLNDGPGSGQYQAFTGAGFVDVWAAMHPGDQGLTCCQTAPDLSNPTPTFDQRIDMVLVKGINGASGKLQGQITIVGNTPGDRVDGPAGKIWPSDHAGLVAEFRTK